MTGAHTDPVITGLGIGETVTVSIQGDALQLWTGELLAADPMAIRLRLRAARFGPVMTAEDGEIVISWRGIERIDIDNPTIESDRTAAYRERIPHLSKHQLLNNVDRYQVAMDDARSRGDLRAHLDASACWNATWDELDRRDFQANQPAQQVAS